MPRVWIGASAMLDRTLEVLNPENKLPRVPYPVKFTQFDRVIPVFGPVKRPTFWIDESELPY